MIAKRCRAPLAAHHDGPCALGGCWIQRVSTYNRLALLPANAQVKMSERVVPPGARKKDVWADAEDGAAELPFKRLSPEEAQALRSKEPPISPWRVLGVQAVVGVVVALIAGLLTANMAVLWSALYGAAAVVLPGALLARGMTSRLTGMSPGVSAVSFMLWEFVKIAASIAMLALAPRIVPTLSWPVLLVAMVVCMKVYWVALLWRGR